MGEEMSRILIVDDDRQFRTMLSRLLAGKGHMVLECGDGEEVEAILGSDRVDLVFLDMIMEKKGGLEALKDIRMCYPHIPVVLVSGNSIELVRDVFGAADLVGAVGYLQKPFSAQALFQAVDDALS